MPRGHAPHTRCGTTVAARNEAAQSDLARLRKRMTVSADGCWLIDDGTKYVKIGNPQVLAHRAVIEFTEGPLSSEVVVHHECERPGCINPAHLRVMPSSDHMRLHQAKRHAA